LRQLISLTDKIPEKEKLFKLRFTGDLKTCEYYEYIVNGTFQKWRYNSHLQEFLGTPHKCSIFHIFEITKSTNMSKFSLAPNMTRI